MALQTDAKCFLLTLSLGGLVVLLDGRLDYLIRLILSLVFYGIVALLAYNFIILPLVMKFIGLRRRQDTERREQVPVSEIMERRELSVEKQQTRLRKDASEYKERVMMPKEEARRKKQEKNMKFAVKTFPDGGTKLGGTDGDQSLEEFGEDDNEKRFVIAFRLPTGTTVRKKFSKASSCLLMKSFVEKLGYPLSKYRVLEGFHRKVIDLDRDGSLEDAGLLSNTMLVIEKHEGLE